MLSGRTKISPKSGRGLGHVTPTIFVSTVGYPSDSLDSCTEVRLKSNLVINGGRVDSLKSRKYKLNLIVAGSLFKSNHEYFGYTRTNVQNF